MVEADFSHHLFYLDRISRFYNTRLLLIDLLDFLIRGHRRGETVSQPAQHLHRPYDISGILHESRQLPQRHLTVYDKFPTDQNSQQW